MPVQPTSLAAYQELQEKLPAHEARVLKALHAYRDECGQWPTAYELFMWMREKGLAQDLNDTRPRLTALKEKGQVENPTIKRHCRITSKRAFTWSAVRPEKLF